MRATFGATFSEKNHTDKGPNYVEKFRKNGAIKPRLSVDQYNKIFKNVGVKS